MSTDLSPELVRRALDGDPQAQRLLVEKLTPVIQVHVAGMLRRWRTGSAAGRDLRQEVEDMVQEVFLELIRDDGKALRRWDPQRLPLDAYAGFIARIRTAGVLRSPRAAWRDEPNPGEALDRTDPRATPEDRTARNEELEKVYLCLIASFQSEDAHLFELLFVRQASPAEATAATGKSLDAVYKWRSRLYQKARECRDRLSEGSS